jgi:hypothetical protein
VKRAGAALLLAVAVAACQSTGSVNGWIWPSPAPLPAGAVAVPLDVEPIPSDVPALASFACPMALSAPITITYVPDDTAHPIHYTQTESGLVEQLVWQVGFTARLDPGLEIVAPDGSVIAKAGENPGFGGGGNDSAFHVCIGAYLPTRG